MVSRERFPAAKDFRKLTAEEAKEMTDRFLADPKVVAMMAEARASKARGDGIKLSELKKLNGRS